MNQKNNDDKLDLIFGKFLNVIKYSYSPQFYHGRVTESKNKSLHFVNSFKIKKQNKNKTKKLIENIDTISISIYNYFCSRLRFVSYSYFPYFRYLRQDGNYHFHFLIFKKDYF